MLTVRIKCKFTNYCSCIYWARSMSDYLRAQKKFCNITKTEPSKFQIFGFDDRGFIDDEQEL